MLQQALILGSYEAVVCVDDDILITNPRTAPRIPFGTDGAGGGGESHSKKALWPQLITYHAAMAVGQQDRSDPRRAGQPLSCRQAW